MAIIWTGLAPHPPIIVPEVGGPRCREVSKTIESMQALSKDLIASNPDRLILISPHTPRPYSGIGLWSGPKISGNFAQFGAPQAQISLNVDQNWLKKFKNQCITTELGDQQLDHGAMVPLYFLYQQGWRGPTVVLGLPWDEGDALSKIGKAIANVSHDDQNTAILASGDMSHCLKPSAPEGFDPNGPEFDAQFVAHISKADYHNALTINTALQKAARQDVVSSCKVTWEASNFNAEQAHFYSYEGPFGVGYSVMRFSRSHS